MFHSFCPTPSLPLFRPASLRNLCLVCRPITSAAHTVYTSCAGCLHLLRTLFTPPPVQAVYICCAHCLHLLLCRLFTSVLLQVEYTLSLKYTYAYNSSTSSPSSSRYISTVPEIYDFAVSPRCSVVCADVLCSVVMLAGTLYGLRSTHGGGKASNRLICRLHIFSTYKITRTILITRRSSAEGLQCFVTHSLPAMLCDSLCVPVPCGCQAL